MRRWTMEVTLQEARTHLGIETQRQWNDLAIGRTTPTLFGLYSLVTRLAHGLLQADASIVRTVAWYAKPRPTFADAIAGDQTGVVECLLFCDVTVLHGDHKNPALGVRALD